MRVMLKLTLNCDADAAWDAIRNPAVFTAVSSPLTMFESLEPEGFPALWSAGDHPVRVRAMGLVPIGVQVIGISFPERSDGVRVMRDSGRGLSGPLAAITRWEHTMAVSSAPDGRTLYRDQLIFEAGVITPLLWPVYWAFWQFRAWGLARLAPQWKRAAP